MLDFPPRRSSLPIPPARSWCWPCPGTLPHRRFGSRPRTSSERSSSSPPCHFFFRAVCPTTEPFSGDGRPGKMTNRTTASVARRCRRSRHRRDEAGRRAEDGRGRRPLQRPVGHAARTYCPVDRQPGWKPGRPPWLTPEARRAFSQGPEIPVSGSPPRQARMQAFTASPIVAGRLPAPSRPPPLRGGPALPPSAAGKPIPDQEVNVVCDEALPLPRPSAQRYPTVPVERVQLYHGVGSEEVPAQPAPSRRGWTASGR